MIRNHHQGWITIEMISVVGVLLLIGDHLATLLGVTKRFNAEQMARMRCLAAAQAELDSLVARGTGLGEHQVQRLWPGVALQVQRAPGQGDWEGLDRLEVIAERALRGTRRTVQVRLVRYMPREDQP